MGLPAAVLIRELQKRLNVVATVEAVELYRSLFFDTAAVSRTQLQLLVRERVRFAVKNTALGGPAEQRAVDRAVLRDARVIACSLSASPAGWGAVLMALGFTPAKQDLARTVVELQNLAAVQAGHALLRGARGDERRAAGFVDVLRTLHDLRETVQDPGADLMRGLRAVTFRHREQRIPTMADLRSQGAGVTTDVAPPIEEGVVGEGDDEGEDAA